MNGRAVMPGDELAASEEFMPGPGTYERGGKVHAAVAGVASFNDAEKTVSVEPARRASGLRRGDAVLGEVTATAANLVTVHIAGIEGAPGTHGPSEYGVIHISKVSEGYVDDARRELKPGDLVRARVLQAGPSLQLSTRDPDLGVLKALCGRCRGTLCNRQGALYCPACEREERRKLAEDFARFTPPCPGGGC